MATRIAIWGAPSAGKSALASAISQELGIALIQEFATEWLRENGLEAWHREGPRVQALFGREQLNRERLAMVAQMRWVTDSPSGLCWPYASKREDADIDVNHECYGVFVRALEGYTHNIFLPLGDFSYDQTRIRIPEAEALEVDRWLRAMLDMHGVNYLVVRGGIPDRLRAVSEYVGVEEHAEAQGGAGFQPARQG